MQKVTRYVIARNEVTKQSYRRWRNEIATPSARNDFVVCVHLC